MIWSCPRLHIQQMSIGMSLRVSSHSPHFPLSHNFLQGRCYLQCVPCHPGLHCERVTSSPFSGSQNLEKPKGSSCLTESCHANRRLPIIVMISNSRRDVREEVGCEYIMSAQFASECSDTFTSLNGPRLTESRRSVSFLHLVGEATET